MALGIQHVAADPLLAFDSVGADGRPMHTEIVAGSCSVEKQVQKLFSTGRRAPTQLGFYVPGAGPYRASHLLSAWAEASLTWVQVPGGNGATRAYGVRVSSVQLVEDGASVYPYVWLTAFGGESMGVSYRLTVTQPLPE